MIATALSGSENALQTLVSRIAPMNVTWVEGIRLGLFKCIQLSGMLHRGTAIDVVPS